MAENLRDKLKADSKKDKMYYFASDTHLGLDAATSSLERERLLVRWLEDVSADAKTIYLVGDIFDFWFEWKRVVPKGFTRLLGKLSELTDRGVDICFFTGNHDMWAYDYLTKECGVRLYNKPQIVELYGKTVFIAHGDNMYVRKPFGERMMQIMFHSRFCRKAFAKFVHPNISMKFGHWWSHNSRKAKPYSHIFKGEQESLVGYARNYQENPKNAKIDYFIFGHIHCAEIYNMGNGSKALFLGEWLDNPTYATLNSEGEIDFYKVGG